MTTPYNGTVPPDGYDGAALSRSLLNLSWLRRQQGRFQESEALCRSAEDRIAKELGNSDLLLTLTAKLYLGALYAEWAWAERTTDRPAATARAMLATAILRTNLTTAIGDPRVSEKRLASLQFQLGNAIAVAAASDPDLPATSRDEALAEAGRLIQQGAKVLQPIRRDQPANYRECLGKLIRFSEIIGNTTSLLESQERLAQMATEREDHEQFD